MDKNLAALLRDDTRTIKVQFETNGQQYTYVTELDLQVGDHVVVTAREQLKVVQVVQVDDELDIQPNGSIAYQWVVGKVDMTQHQARTERNRQITDAVAKTYRKQMRKAFAEQILADLPAESRTALLSSVSTVEG